MSDLGIGASQTIAFMPMQSREAGMPQERYVAEAMAPRKAAGG